MLFSLKNIRKMTALLVLEITILGLIVTTITLAYVNEGKLTAKSIQIENMYENWLTLRSYVISYIAAPKANRSEREGLISSFEKFDSSMVQISDEDVFRKIERNNSQAKDIRTCLVYDWQKIQYQLVMLLQFGNNLDDFATMVLWMSRDTQEMDSFFGLLREIVHTESLRQQRQNLLISYSIIIVFMIISFLAFFLNFRTEHKLEHGEELQKMAKTIFRIRDDERKRIALDIHDSLICRLRELKTYTDSAVKDNCREHISSEIMATIDEARDISFNLIPFLSSNESGEGFINVIKNYSAEILVAKNIHFTISSTGFNKILLPEDLRISMFRVCQEILNNIIKYSRADTVTMKFLYSHPFVMFSIADNGCGLSETNLGSLFSKDHIGFYGMHERVKLHGGTLTVTSKPGMGTKLSIRIPLKGKEDG